MNVESNVTKLVGPPLEFRLGKTEAIRVLAEVFNSIEHSSETSLSHIP